MRGIKKVNPSQPRLTELAAKDTSAGWPEARLTGIPDSPEVDTVQASGNKVNQIGMFVIRFFILPICISLLFFPAAGVFAQEVALAVSFDKEEYRLSDPIFVDFNLKNNGKKEVYVNGRFFLNADKKGSENGEVYLVVTSPSGEVLPSKATYVTGLPKTDCFLRLRPGEEADSERKRNIRPYFDFSRPGLYKVRAVYQNKYGKEIGLDVIDEEIVSDEVVIRIVGAGSSRPDK